MRRSSLVLAVFAIVASLTALAVMELVVSLIAPAPEVIRLSVSHGESAFQFSSNPLLGYELKPNVRANPTVCHHSFPFTNGDGQRDLDRAVEKSSEVTRVALLGDSVVAGHGQCDFEETVSRQLEHALIGVEVLNFGVGGYCTLSEVELFRVKGVKYEPDLVVVLFVANDYINANASAGQIIGFERPAFINELFLHSHIFRRVALRFDFMSFREQFFPPPRPVTEGDNVEKGFAMLKELAAAHGFKPLIALWPFFIDTEIITPGRKPFRAPPGPDVTEIAARFELETLDLAPAFREHFRTLVAQRKRGSRKASPRWIYTQGDGTHPTAMGATVGAQALARALEPYGVTRK